MALEEFLVDGDVLDGDEAAARLVLGDRVDEHRRIPVAQPVEQDGDVDAQAWQMTSGRWPIIGELKQSVGNERSPSLRLGWHRGRGVASRGAIAAGDVPDAAGLGVAAAGLGAVASSS